MTWTVAGVAVPVQADIELTAATLSLSFVVSTSELTTWREVGDRAGDLAVETGAGGALRTIARGTSGTLTVDADAADAPPIATSEWYVDGYSEEQLAPQRYELELDLQRPTNRRDEFTLDDIDVSSADEGFGLNFGEDFGAGAQLALLVELGGEGLTLGITERQLGQLDRDGAPTGADVTMPLLLSVEQAAAVADAAGYPEAVVERTVPDGDSLRVDESGGRQTLGLQTRDDVALDDGNWLLSEWSLERHSYTTGRRWRAELTLAATDS